MAYAIQSKTYGAPTRADIKKNLENVCKQIDGCMYISDADYPAKLVALPEGALQGFYDEHSRMDSVEICRKIAITLPGEESDVLAETAKKWGIYIIVPAKVIEPEIIPDRFFNTVFIIDPQGKIIHRYRKSRVFTLEASTTPHDVYDLWLEKVGKDPEAFFPVVDTPIGKIGTLLAFDGKFPEAARALALNGAEIIYRGSELEYHKNMGYWEVMNRSHALSNCCYVIAPNNGPKYYDTNEGNPSMTGSAGGGSMVVNYRGQIMSEVKNVNISYAAAMINIDELRSYREKSSFYTLPYLAPELWSLVYSSASKRVPSLTKNRYIDRPVPDYNARKKMNDDAKRKWLEAFGELSEEDVKDLTDEF